MTSTVVRTEADYRLYLVIGHCDRYLGLSRYKIHCVSKKYATQPPTLILTVIVRFQ